MINRTVAETILQGVGGKANILHLTHCFTRLRFVLRDESLVQTEKLNQVEGVISVRFSGGQLQVVCGAKVEQIYDMLISILEEQTEVQRTKEVQESAERKNGHRALQIITEIFTPLIPAIAAAGLIKGLLTAVKLLMQQRGVDISGTDTYVILFAASQVIFYFFPIFLAMTTAKALHCNQVIAMVIAGLLVYPSIDAMITDTSVTNTIFGLPVIKGAWEIGGQTKVFSYTESVIPIILAVIVMAYIERFLKKIIPEVIQLILVPGLELVLLIPITLSILGPIGIYIGNAIQVLYDAVILFSPILGGALVGGLWGVFVIFGAHRALLPIGLNDVAINGRQNILAFAGAANFAQGGAALGVWLKTKDKEVKQIAASGTISATFVGITEPAIYGCNLRYKKPFLYAILAGAIGGGVMGFGKVYGDAFANNGLLTIFTYAAFGMTRFLFYLAGILIAYVGAAVLTYFFGYENESKKKQVEIEEPEKGNEEFVEHLGIHEKERIQEQKVIQEQEISKLLSPIKGILLPLSEVPDSVFSSGDLGPGIAIVPIKGEVIAPDDCEVTVLYHSLHAIGLTLDNGIELLIHIGINTVELDGKHFQSFVTSGSHVKKGTKLLTFDLEQMLEEGYDVTTPLIITNGNTVIETTEKRADYQTIILHCTTKS